MTPVLDPEVLAEDRPVTKKKPTCICGRGNIAGTMPPCGHYAAYTTGYCRRCSHGRACCKRGRS